ncbi:MAG: hypothetical protein AAF485_25900 [Chloroflexota bacterium]
MNRRNFLRVAGISAAGGLATYTLAKAKVAEASSNVVTYNGSDFSDNGIGQPWEMVLGDGLYAAPGQAWPTVSDLAISHQGTHSELQANTTQRGIMAHNITFNRRIDNVNSPMPAFDAMHLCKTNFRLPQVPSTSSWPFNAQTLEITFFIWDGSNTLNNPAGPMDYGVALQWILNPWMSTFGEIRTWASDNGGSWISSGYYLTPDTNVHTAELVLDVTHRATALIIDGQDFPISISETPKYGWGTETAARLSSEMISIWPGPNPTGPSFEAEFSDWQWDWIPNDN